MWNKSTNPLTKKNLMTYLKNNYILEQQFVSEHNTKITYYTGIQPKDYIIKRENSNKLPYYEEFVLSECKFDYTYRTTKAILYNEFRGWVFKKYPQYVFSQEEQIHMESYLNRTFFNCKKIHINGGTNGYYGLQLKSDTTEILGVSELRRKKVYKINVITNEIVETYENLSIASIKSQIEYKKLSNFILTKTKIENYIYSYDL